MKKRFSWIFLICLSLTLTGCSIQGLMGKKPKQNQATAQGDKKETIAVALDEKDPNMALLLRGLEDMAKKEDVKLEILSANPATEKSEGGSGGDKSGQGSSGKKSESPLKGAKILIYQGGKPELLQSAQKDKIPVLALNELPPGLKAEGVVLPDPDQSGTLMAEAVLRKANEGQVVYLQGDPGDSAGQEMVASFKNALQKNPKLTVQTLINPAGSEAVAKHNLLEYLKKNPDKVQVVCAQNEKLALQAHEALKTAQLDKKVHLVGGQATLQSLQRIASGQQAADIDTAPYIQGVNAFQWAKKIMKKEALDINQSVSGEQGEVPAKIIPVKPVTPENLAVTQKSYAKTFEAQKKAEAEKQEASDKKGEEKKTAEKSGDKKDAESGQSGKNGASGSGSDSGSGGGSSGQNSQVPLPQGAVKVNERVRTEVTREFLDAQGKVISTEKSANDQVRTIPPEMLNQEKGKGQESKEQEDKGKDAQGGEKASEEGGKKKS